MTVGRVAPVGLRMASHGCAKETIRHPERRVRDLGGRGRAGRPRGKLVSRRIMKSGDARRRSSDQRNFMLGSPNRIHELRTSGSLVAVFARIAASPMVAPAKRCL